MQKQEVKSRTWKFPPINVVCSWCTQAIWWGCIAPYSHCVSTGRGGGRERVEEIICQKYCAVGLDSCFGKSMVGNCGQTYLGHSVQEEFVFVILQAHTDEIKCTFTFTSKNLCRLCHLAVFGVYLSGAGTCTLTGHQGLWQTCPMDCCRRCLTLIHQQKTGRATGDISSALKGHTFGGWA